MLLDALLSRCNRPRFGRRPTLLYGTLGTALSMCLFGFSRSMRTALLARFLTGALNANVAIVKTYLGEICDTSTVARGFALLSLTWGTGCIVAPMLGGYLSEPATQFPAVFGGIPFFIEFPYVLPALVSVGVALTAFVVGIVWLPETEVWAVQHGQAQAQQNHQQQQQHQRGNDEEEEGIGMVSGAGAEAADYGDATAAAAAAVDGTTATTLTRGNVVGTASKDRRPPRPPLSFSASARPQPPINSSSSIAGALSDDDAGGGLGGGRRGDDVDTSSSGMFPGGSPPPASRYATSPRSRGGGGGGASVLSRLLATLGSTRAKWSRSDRRMMPVGHARLSSESAAIAAARGRRSGEAGGGFDLDGAVSEGGDSGNLDDDGDDDGNDGGSSIGSDEGSHRTHRESKGGTRSGAGGGAPSSSSSFYADDLAPSASLSSVIVEGGVASVPPAPPSLSPSIDFSPSGYGISRTISGQQQQRGQRSRASTGGGPAHFSLLDIAAVDGKLRGLSIVEGGSPSFGAAITPSGASLGVPAAAALVRRSSRSGSSVGSTNTAASSFHHGSRGPRGTPGAAAAAAASSTSTRAGRSGATTVAAASAPASLAPAADDTPSDHHHHHYHASDDYDADDDSKQLLPPSAAAAQAAAPNSSSSDHRGRGSASGGSISSGGGGGEGARPSFSSLLRDPAIFRAVACYACLAASQVLFDEILPVFCETSTADGGLGLKLDEIGRVQVAQGVAQIVAQLTFVPPLITRVGPLRAFRYGMLPLAGLFFFPAIGRLALHPSLLWPILSAAVALKAVLMAVTFTGVMICINNSSRGQSLGLVNGLGQTAASFVRAAGPFLGGPLFSASIGFGGWLGAWKLHVVYMVQAAAALAAFGLSYRLPAWIDDTPSFDDVAKYREREEAGEGGAAVTTSG